MSEYDYCACGRLRPDCDGSRRACREPAWRPVQPVEKLSAREAARRRIPLDGSDSQALEHALTMTEHERDAALARAEQAERERDAAEREAERWRHGVPVEGDYVCPNDLRAYHAECALRRAEARAAVVVWGLGEGGWCVWRVSERWVYYVPFAALETAPTLSCPRLTDSPLADVTDAIVDAIAATHGCPESLRVGWEGVRDAV